MKGAFATVAASGNAPQKPEIITTRSGNTNTTVTYNFLPGYSFGRTATSASSQNAICSVPSSVPNRPLTCQVYTTIKAVTVPSQDYNIAGPLISTDLYAWKVRVINSSGYECVFETTRL